MEDREDGGFSRWRRKDCFLGYTAEDLYLGVCETFLHVHVNRMNVRDKDPLRSLLRVEIM